MGRETDVQNTRLEHSVVGTARDKGRSEQPEGFSDAASKVISDSDLEEEAQ